MTSTGSALDEGPPRLVLASASPRRAELLRMLGLEFEAVPPSVAEVRGPGEGAEAYVLRLAVEKAAEVGARRPGGWVLAGDTVVVLDGRVLEKPSNAEEAARMLGALSGRTHRVLTGVAASAPGGATASGVEETRVRFRALATDEIESYVRTGEPMDKAGSYGIQGLGAALVAGLEGDYFNVVGLPVVLSLELLARCGLEYRFGAVVRREGVRVR